MFTSLRSALTADLAAGWNACFTVCSWPATNTLSSSAHCWYQGQGVHSSFPFLNFDPKPAVHWTIYKVCLVRLPHLLYIPLTSCSAKTCFVVHSPHIRTIRERIAVNEEKISEADYAGLSAQDSAVMQQALEGSFGSLSHFEVLTALAFKYFQRNKVQHASILTIVQQCAIMTPLRTWNQI